MNPPSHAALRAPINLTLPWHKSVIEVTDCNHNIVTGKLSETLKQQTPPKPRGPKDFFSAVGY